jgi:hypothetical protein
MNWRRFVISLFVLLGAAVSLLAVSTTAQASPKAARFTIPQEGTKVILGETSIDGPAIASMPTGTGPSAVVAWTGTDAAHHLNLLTSTDGLHYSNKHILPETSLWRPAVEFIQSMRTGYGTIVLAWTGTDQAHTLNLELISTPNFTVLKKITFWGETSFTAPALTSINGDVNSDIYLAWAGTDSAHTLNIIHYSTAAGTSQKQTLWGWSSISRPNLTTDPSPGSTTAMILSWTGFNNHIYFAGTSDKVHWTMPSTSPLAYQSAWAPSLMAFYSTTVPTHWMAWTGSGTTSTLLLNVQYTQHYPSWSDAGSTVTLGEKAISSPELAGGFNSSQILVAWTGTDPLHHLNVAVISVTA